MKPKTVAPAEEIKAPEGAANIKNNKPKER